MVMVASMVIEELYTLVIIEVVLYMLVRVVPLVVKVLVSEQSVV